MFFPVAVSLGCWTNEPSSFAIPSVEGLFPKVNDSYHFRVAALRRCADVATSTGSLVFALQNGGQCLTAPDAQITFSTYGPSGGCGNSGKGGANAMNVYSFNKGRSRDMKPNANRRIPVIDLSAWFVWVVRE